jgi:hypothetical protein
VKVRVGLDLDAVTAPAAAEHGRGGPNGLRARDRHGMLTAWVDAWTSST